MTKIETVNAAMAQAPYFALSPEAISKLREQTPQNRAARSDQDTDSAA